MRGLLYIGQVYIRGAAKVAVWPTVGLIRGCVVGVVGVADCCIRAVQAVFAA